MKIDCNEPNGWWRRKIRRKQLQQKWSHWAINRAFIAVKSVHEDLWFLPKHEFYDVDESKNKTKTVKCTDSTMDWRMEKSLNSDDLVEKNSGFFFRRKDDTQTGEIRTNKKPPKTVNVALCFKNLWLSLSCAYFLPFFSTIVSTSIALNFEYLFTEYRSIFKWL